LSSSIAHGDLAVCCGGSFNPFHHTGSFGIAFAEKLHPFWVCLVRTVVHPVSSLLT
jgi:uridylate kinase